MLSSISESKLLFFLFLELEHEASDEVDGIGGDNGEELGGDNDDGFGAGNGDGVGADNGDGIGGDGSVGETRFEFVQYGSIGENTDA